MYIYIPDHNLLDEGGMEFNLLSLSKVQSDSSNSVDTVCFHLPNYCLVNIAVLCWIFSCLFW